MEILIIILLFVITFEYFTVIIQLEKIKHQNHFLIIKQISMSQTQEEAAAQLSALSDQLTKAKGEIVAKIQALTDAAAAADNVDPALQTAIDNLAPIAQQLDDIVPDAPVVTPPADGSGDTTPPADGTTEPAA